MTQPDEFDLEAVFAAARAAPPQMPDGLAVRIVADAQAHLPTVPLWQRVMTSIGGPAGLGGLVTATVVGFWIGIAPPDAMIDPLLLIGGESYAEDVEDGFADLSGFGWDSEEG